VTAGLVFSCMCSAYGILWLQRELQTVCQERDLVMEQLEFYRHTVFVAEEKLPKGSRLTEDKLYQEIRYSDLPQEEFITEQEFGMVLAMDIPAGTYLTKQMVCEEQHSVKEIFLSEVKFTEHLQTGDRIDVRIRYANAEDYVILADKAITKQETGNGMLLYLTEEELLLLASAIADSGEYGSTWLYAVRYPEYEASAKTQVTYIANHDVLKLLGREKTEGESRTALERRLMQKQ